MTPPDNPPAAPGDASAPTEQALELRSLRWFELDQTPQPERPDPARSPAIVLADLWMLVKHHGPRVDGREMFSDKVWRLAAVETPAGALGGIGGEMMRRWPFVRNFGYAVPSPEALRRLVSFVAGGRVLGAGAGAAFWSYLLTLHGIAVQPIDPNVDGLEVLPSMANDMPPLARIKPWMPVTKLTVMEALQNANRVGAEPVDVLMFLWPSYQESWAVDALREFRGSKIAYVGEAHGGCTADDAFHELLDEKFSCVEEVEIPQWFGIHDRLFLYERKT